MAYYNKPNNNFGIPTLDLTQFGLAQPQNNMQIAELFNYNTLPQATKSFTPRSTMTTGNAVDNFIKDNPNATRGDFMKALQDGTLRNSSRQLFEKNVDALFEGVNLDKDYFGSVKPTYQGLNDKTFRGNIDIDKESLNKKALESLPKGFFLNVGDQSSLIGPGGYPMTAMAIDPNRMTDAGYMGFGLNNTGRNFDRDFSQLGDVDSFRSRMSERPSENTLQARQASSARSLGMDKEIEKEKGIFSLGDILADLGRKGVEGFKDVAGRGIASQGLRTAGGMILGPMGALAGGIFGALKGGDMFTPSQSQIDFNALTPEGKAAVGDIYGPNGIMSGYNAVSAFGRGPVGAIDARLDKLGTRRALQTDLSKQRAKDLFAAREKIMQTTLDSDSQYTGPKSSPRGQKAGVMDDDPFGGTSETTGTSSKIVCTMMNDSYGFGNFRNKIWLKHSKDLPKEYEIGYHKIFLPLVKFAKGQGKLNKAVKKTLEHVARHRTLDLKQEMKGKTHLLGRIYRKILEPICFIVGKVSNNV